MFRCAKKTGIVKPETGLRFLGFGTLNGKDGKPFKTREGGVMRLEYLISDIDEQMYQKIAENPEISPEEAKETAKIVGLSAIKYGDLSNQASKDYVLISTGLPPLREIQVLTFCIPSSASSPS